MKRLLLLVSILLIAQFCLGATIEGKLFDWETLGKIDSAIIDVNSVPPQRVVAENGEYSFEVPPGTYSIEAMQFVNGKLARIARETLIVKEEGRFTVDLVLKPATEEDLAAIEEKGFEAELAEVDPLETIALPGAVAMILVLIVYIAYKRFGKKEEKEKIEASVREELDKYAREVVEVLKRCGNRLTQKELREKCTLCGEAKISLVLAELEAMGKIKKIKKGRGNIIVLKEL